MKSISRQSILYIAMVIFFFLLIPFSSAQTVDPMCTAGTYIPREQLLVGLSIDPDEGSMNKIISGFQELGVDPTVYTDGEVVNGKPTTDGITVLVIARKIVMAPVSQDYVLGVKNFIANGGSILAEYDGAALMFTTFAGVNDAFQGKLNPAIELFTGNVAGGGILLPISASTMYVTDPNDPIMEGVDSELYGLRAAFALTGYNDNWLHPSSTFTSTGYGDLVPAGTFPAVLSGRCGPSRIALFMMNHLQHLMFALPVQTMVNNALNWLVEGDHDGIPADGDQNGTPADNPCSGGAMENCDDNCPNTPNGPDGGTCMAGPNAGETCGSYLDCGGYDCSKNQEDTDSDGVGDVCDNCPNDYNPLQEDTYPPQKNGIGDACDCEGDFDCSGGVDAADVDAFLLDFGRSTFINPCSNADPCNGDFNCDVNVDAADVTTFLDDFGRSQFNNPCPSCVGGNWCVY